LGELPLQLLFSRDDRVEPFQEEGFNREIGTDLAKGRSRTREEAEEMKIALAAEYFD
jgi:hypothetical protein